MDLKEINRAEAFRYMGYKGGEIPANIEALADECEQSLLAKATPKFVWRVFDIEKTENGIEIKNTALALKGADIAEHLRGCEKCVLLAATLGAGADGVIRAYEAVAMEKALITDSLASAAIEQVCDAAEREIQPQLEGFYFTWRFSPGYGDLPLDIQGEFLNALDTGRRIGLTVSDSLILTPRKSVTAVIGVSTHEIAKGKRGCGCCKLKGQCEYRKRGSHCGWENA